MKPVTISLNVMPRTEFERDALLGVKAGYKKVRWQVMVLRIRRVPTGRGAPTARRKMIVELLKVAGG